MVLSNVWVYVVVYGGDDSFFVKNDIYIYVFVGLIFKDGFLVGIMIVMVFVLFFFEILVDC